MSEETDERILIIGVIIILIGVLAYIVWFTLIIPGSRVIIRWVIMGLPSYTLLVLDILLIIFGIMISIIPVICGVVIILKAIKRIDENLAGE